MDSLRHGRDVFRPSVPIRDALGLVMIWRCAFGVTMTFSWFPRELLLVGFAVWIALAAATEGARLHRLVRTSFPLILFVLANITIDLVVLGDVSQLISNFVVIWMLYVLGGFYAVSGGRFRAAVLTLLALDTAIIMVVTLVELRAYPNIVRLGSTAEGSAGVGATYDTRLIATYALVYACVVLAVFFFSMGVWTRGRYRLAGLSLAVLIAWWILQTSFAIALIMLILFFTIVIIDRAFSLNLVGKAIIVTVLAGIPLVFRESVGRSISSWDGSEMFGEILSSKSSDLGVGLEQGSSAMSDLRVELYVQSLSVFMNNVLVGVHSVPAAEGVAGGHAGWLDGLAWFGLLRYLPLIYFMWKLRVPFTDAVSLGARKSYDSVFLAIVLIGFVNPIFFPQLWLVFFVVVPLCIGSPLWGSEERDDRDPLARRRTGARTPRTLESGVYHRDRRTAGINYV